MKALNFLIISFITIILFLSSFVYADMGAKSEAEFLLTLGGKPFNNALVSLQECQEIKRYSSSDYSLAGLGEASKLFESNFKTISFIINLISLFIGAFIAF